MSGLGPRRWAALATAAAVGALVAVLLDLNSPVRAVVVFGFVLLVPGMSLARLLGFDEWAVNIALGCALGIALTGAVAGVLIYAGHWSPTFGLVFLVLITLGAVATELRRAEAGRAGHLSRSPGSRA